MMGITTWASWGHHSVCHMGIRTWASWGHGPACPHLKDEGALRLCAHHTHVSIFTPGHREAFWVTLTPGRGPGTAQRRETPSPSRTTPMRPGGQAGPGKQGGRGKEPPAREDGWGVAMAAMGCGALKCGGAGQGAGTCAEQRAWPTHSTGLVLRPPLSSRLSPFAEATWAGRPRPHCLIFFSLVPL